MEFLDNGLAGGSSHKDALQKLVAKSTGSIRISTGFVSVNGLVDVANIIGMERELYLLVGDLNSLKGSKPKLNNVKKVLDWLENGNVKVRTVFSGKNQENWNLHAKVWIFENAAVITSANLSSRGLENQPEMGVIIKSEEELESLNKWFDKAWNKYHENTPKLKNFLESELTRNERELIGAGSNGTEASSKGCLQSAGAFAVASTALFAFAAFLYKKLKR